MTSTISSLEHLENGSHHQHTSATSSDHRPLGVYDAPEATEDDPLLVDKDTFGELSDTFDAANRPRSDTSINTTRGVFTRRKSDVVRKKRHVVSYDSDSHLKVLFQMHGSVWPYVLPYCVVAVLFTFVVYYLDSNGIADLTFPNSNGHNFMAIMVSFLLVTRANITYARFMEARQYLSTCYRSCRELIQHMAVLTLQDDSVSARLWRQDVAYRTILLLRVTMAAIEYRSSAINTWDVLTATDGGERLQLLTPTTTTSKSHKREISNVMPSSKVDRIQTWAHGERTMMDENLRAPTVLVYNLRETLLRERQDGVLLKPMHVNEELKLLSFISDYMAAFSGLKKLITTPFPFPLVQMTRSFLFFWVFSLPLVLLHETEDPIQVMVLIFFACYGFLGLEYVSMELDDPFGDDPNDMDVLGMAEVVFEDIYITIYKRDGTASAEQLRDRVVKREQKGDALTTYHENVARDAF